MEQHRKYEPRTPLTVEKYGCLVQIFDSKDWAIYEDGFSDSVFDKFVKLLESLNEDEQDLVLKLTRDYLWIPSGEYMKHVRLPLNSIVEHTSSIGKRRLIILPLIPSSYLIPAEGQSIPANVNQFCVKSAHVLWYMMRVRSAQIARYGQSHGLEITMEDNYANLMNYVDEHTCFCLVDDFIGTGTQATKAIEYLTSILGLGNELFSILVLVIQCKGKELLLEKGVYTAFSIERRRGITDVYGANSSEANIMKALEKKMNVGGSFKFGYKKSEALVSMESTPNNTFPIYWRECDYTMDVPFLRTAK